MPKLNFSNLDSTGKRAIYWLADEADTLTSTITDAAYHIGEIYEAVAFMKEYPKGTVAHAVLADRLRLGGKSNEDILACIVRAAPTYRSVIARDTELDELLTDLRSMFSC